MYSEFPRDGRNCFRYGHNIHRTRGMSRSKKIHPLTNLCKATMKQSLIKPWPLVALIILLSVSIVDAVTSHQSWGITSPSLLKRSFFHKLSDLRRRRRQVGASDAITTDGIPTGSNNANNIENAVTL